MPLHQDEQDIEMLGASLLKTGSNGTPPGIQLTNYDPTYVLETRRALFWLLIRTISFFVRPARLVIPRMPETLTQSLPSQLIRPSHTTTTRFSGPTMVLSRNPTLTERFSIRH